MKLSAPIHILKSKAKALKKDKGILMSHALDQIAQEEGFNSWSLLQTKVNSIFPQSYQEIFSFFNPGDLVLIGSRPGQGKTSFTIGLFVQAIKKNKAKNFYFTLAETKKDVAGRLAIYDKSVGENNPYFDVSYSNDICAEYIINYTQQVIEEGSVIVIDYLQLLDEKRIHPPIQKQLEALKTFAKEKKCILIFLSQVRREIEYKYNKRPTVEDIRLPNPLDIKLFNKKIFLYRESKESKEVEVSFAGVNPHVFKVGWNREEVKFF